MVCFGRRSPLPSQQRRDLRDEPAYLIPEAAHHLGLPPSTIRAWTLGYRYRGGRMAPLLRIAAGSPPILSFWNLVEVYVLATIRKRHQVALQKVRKALRYVKVELGKPRPLIEQDFLTDGVNLLVEHYANLVNVSSEGQMALREVLTASLQRIERDPEGLAARFYPWLKDPEEPRHVVIDPLRSFGRPTIAGTGVPTEMLAERWRAGDRLKDLAMDYSLSDEQVETALRWESLLGTKAA